MKKEWEERQKAKKEAAAAKEKDKGKDEASDKDKKDEKQGWLAYLATSLKDATISSPAATTSPTPTTADKGAASATGESSTPPRGHEYYSLNRSFYAMRVDLNNKKLSMKRAKELNFPSVPRA